MSYMISCTPSVAAGIELVEMERILQAGLNAADGAGDLTGDKVSPWTGLCSRAIFFSRCLMSERLGKLAGCHLSGRFSRASPALRVG